MQTLTLTRLLYTLGILWQTRTDVKGKIRQGSVGVEKMRSSRPIDGREKDGSPKLDFSCPFNLHNLFQAVYHHVLACSIEFYCRVGRGWSFYTGLLLKVLRYFSSNATFDPL